MSMLRGRSLDASPELRSVAEVLRDCIDQWEPSDAAQCCNCFKAKVTGTPDRPEAYCTLEPDRRLPLLRLIRAKHRLGFHAASGCEGFEDVD